MDEIYGQPVLGTDATGADTYVLVVAAPPGNRRYRHLSARCSTNSAIISLDAGTTDHLYLLAGVSMDIDGLDIRGAVHAKNAVAASNYASLYVAVW